MKYDAVVVGTGIGGYPAAIYLASKGFKIAAVEEHLVGGECTNYGCVPSKALYQFAESYKTISKLDGTINYKWSNLIEWIKNITKEAREGIEYLFESRNITLMKGKARIKEPHRLVVSNSSEEIEVETDKIVLALGTDPADIPVARFDGKGIISNREALYLEEKPEKILIIGGGVIGVELANMYSALGVDVTIVELLDHILPFTDRDVALAVKTHLSQRKVKILEKTTVIQVEETSGKYTVKLSNNSRTEVDKVIVAVGRKPKTSGIGLENTGIVLDQRGFIKVNEYLETSTPRIYACGDVVGGPLLAHKALLESIIAAKRIVGEHAFTLNYKLVPTTIFSGLEIAYVGYTEKELLSLGIKYVKVRLPIYFLSAVKIKGYKNSFIKILLDEKQEKVLGIHIVAPNASEVISAYLPLYLGKLTLNETSSIPYPHLTVSESLRDLAEYITGEPVHSLKSSSF